MTLAELPIGQPATILAVNEPGPAGERILEMGLTVGTAITVIRRSLFGGPMQLHLRGYHLSMRPTQAANVTVEPCA